MADSLDTKQVEGANGDIFDVRLANNGSDVFTPATFLLPTEVGGLSSASYISTADNNATVIKGSAGQLYGVDIFSLDQTPVYLKMYDSSTDPTPGTTTIKLRFGVAAVASALGLNRGQHYYPHGIAFTAGIAFALVTGITDADNTGVAANEVILNFLYK